MYLAEGSDVSDEDSNLVWWAAVFGSLEIPREIKKWQSHPSTRRLDSSWSQSKATLFLQQYYQMVEAYCKSKWDARRNAQEQKELEAAFVFDPNKWWARPGSDPQKLKHNELTAALRFFLAEVCGEELLARLRSQYVQSSKPEEISWKAILDKSLNTFVMPRLSKPLEDYTSCTREDSVSLSAWVATVIVINARVKKSGVDLPPLMVVETLWDQVADKEKDLFASKPTDIDAFQVAVARIEQEHRRLPTFRKVDCARLVSKRPTLRKKPRKEGKTNSSGRRWEERCGTCGKDSHPTSLCWKNKTKGDTKNETKKNYFCQVCKKTGDHKTDSCPHSSKVQAFLTRVEQAEETVGSMCFAVWDGNNPVKQC